MENKYLMDKLQWFADMLNVQKKYIDNNLENRKKWNNSHIDLAHIASFSDDKMTDMNPDSTKLVGMLYQSVIKFSTLTNNLRDKYSDDPKYEGINEQYLIFVLPEKEIKKYISELNKIVVDIQQFVTGETLK